MKENLPLIEKMVQERLTYKEIGEVFGISKQRVHQVFRNYLTSPFNNSKKLHGHRWSFLLNSVCEVCGVKKVDIHHKNGNRNDNSISNLQPLCREHHLQAERELRDNGTKQWNFRNREKSGSWKKCKICGKEIWILPSKKKSKKFCSLKCSADFQRGKHIKPLKHGTRNMYIYQKCRCGDCRKANTIYCRNCRKRRAEKHVVDKQI